MTDELKSCLDRIEAKFDQIAADNIITKEEKEAYAKEFSDERLEIVKITGDTLQAKDDASQLLIDAMKRNCAKVIISFLLAAFGITLAILADAGIIAQYIYVTITTWGGTIVSALIGLIMNGYLNGSVWTFIGNMLGLLKRKTPTPPALQEPASTLVEAAIESLAPPIIPASIAQAEVNPSEDNPKD